MRLVPKDDGCSNKSLMPWCGHGLLESHPDIEKRDVLHLVYRKDNTESGRRIFENAKASFDDE